MRNLLLSIVVLFQTSLIPIHAQFLLELLRNDSTMFKTNKEFPVKKIVVNGIHLQTKEVFLTVQRENNAHF